MVSLGTIHTARKLWWPWWPPCLVPTHHGCTHSPSSMRLNHLREPGLRFWTHWPHLIPSLGGSFLSASFLLHLVWSCQSAFSKIQVEKHRVGNFSFGLWASQHWLLLKQKGLLPETEGVPSKLTCWNLIPNVMMLEGGDFWMISSWRWSPHEWD